MKKIILLIIGLLLVGCSMGSKVEVTQCVKTLNDPIEIDREINLHHKDNLITKIESSETFYFDKEFTVLMFTNIQKEMMDRHKDSSNLSFDVDVTAESATMNIVIKDIDKATATELALVGLSEDDEEYLPGIVESVRLNENEGYTCTLIED